MKLIAVILSLLIVGSVWAEDKPVNPRVTELATEYQQLTQTEQQLQQRLVMVQQRKLRIEGAIEELQREPKE